MTLHIFGKDFLAEVTFKYCVRENFPDSEFLRSAFFHIQTEYGVIQSISLYLVRMRENTE